MSNVYNNEPPTKGKVVLHTTLGDIEVELWPKEAPKAVRNFCQLCMEGYYDDTIWHRIIPEFLIQAGDPTGTGTGGTSIYGKPFKNEFHSRLKFSHRGLLACATDLTVPDANGSQFFITLERCDHLDRQNTIFGKVAGDTIYNAVRVSEQPTDDADRPLDPPRIVSTTVIFPPFDDIVPRVTRAELAALAEQRAQEAAAVEFKKRKLHGRKTGLLSIGDEVDEDDEEMTGLATVRFRSAHETAAPGDSRLEHVAPGAHDAQVLDLRQQLAFEQKQRTAQDAAAQLADAADAFGKGGPTDKSSDNFEAAMLQRVRDSKAAAAAKASQRGVAAGDAEGASAKHRAASGDDASASDSEGEPGDGARRKKQKKLHMSKAGKGAASKRAGTKVVVDSELLTVHQRAVAAIRQRKLLRSGQDKSTMDRLKQFSTMLDSQPKRAAPAAPAAAPATSQPADAVAGGAGPGEPGAERKASEGYDGQVNKKIDHSAYLPAAWRVDSYIDASDDEDWASLRSHKMQWNSNDQVADPNKRRDDVDDYMVVDPLLEKGKEKWNKQAQAAKKRQNEWAGRVNS